MVEPLPRKILKQPFVKSQEFQKWPYILKSETFLEKLEKSEKLQFFLMQRQEMYIVL